MNFEDSFVPDHDTDRGASLFSLDALRERYRYQAARPWEYHESTANMILGLVEVAERAAELSRYLGPGGEPDLRNVVARLDVALAPFVGRKS